MATVAKRVRSVDVWKLIDRWDIGLLLGGALLFRILYIAIVPFDLVHDEAYYWDWSRRLDWCYYSKPPGIAWLIALFTRATASTPFFVRLPAALLSVLSAYFGYLLGSRIYGRRAGLFTAALVLATPGNAASGVMMTIDSPFLCCWAAALYCLYRMLERDESRIRWAMLTAFAVGIGLLFKQTMLAFPALTAAFVLVSKQDRIELKSVSFWATGFAGLAFLIPVIVWNSQHDWITFAHTRGHFAAEQVTVLKRLAIGSEFLGSQMGLLSPTTYIMLGVVGVVGIRNWRSLGRAEQFLICFWVVPVTLIATLSFKQRIEANWPAPFYASGFVLLAGMACCQLGDRFRLPAWTLRRCLAIGVLSVCVTYSLPFVIAGAGLKGSPVDIAVRMWGWQELGQRVQQKIDALPGGDEMPILVTAGRAEAAELAFYLRHQPQVMLWDENGAVDSQYDLWELPQSFPGENLLIVSKSDRIPHEVRRSFGELQSLGTVAVDISPKRRHELQLWKASSFRGWTEYGVGFQPVAADNWIR